MKPTDEDGTPFSCSTHLSKEVLNWLRKAKLGGAAWDFCSYLHDQTFGNAGWHRQKKESELWTTFDLAAWGYALGWDRSNLRRVLETLIACHIILFEPGEPGTGKGRIGWNRHFEEWLCYDGRKTKPRKGQEQPLLVISNQASIVILDEKRDVATRKITKDACSDSVKITKHARQNGLKITKDASFESSADVAPPALNNKTEEYTTEELQESTPLVSTEQETLFPVAPTEKPQKRTRKPDLLWDKAVELFHAPKGGEVWNWRKYVKQLREDAITPEQLQQAAERYKREHPTWHYSFKAIFNNLGDLLKTTAAPVTGLASAYHFADENGPAWARRPAPEGGR